MSRGGLYGGGGVGGCFVITCSTIYSNFIGKLPHDCFSGNI